MERFHEWYSGLRLLEPRIVPAPKPSNVLSPCELPGGNSIPSGTDCSACAYSVAFESSDQIDVELTLKPVPVWPNTVARLNW